MAAAQSAGPRYSPGWAFVQAFGPRLAWIALMVGGDIAAASVMPFLLIRIVDALNAAEFVPRDAYLAAMGLSLVTIARTLVLHMAFFNAWRVGQGMVQRLQFLAYQACGC